MIIILILMKISLMIYYGKIDLTKGIDIIKSKSSKECTVCHYCYFNRESNFQKSACNSFHVLVINSHINIVIISVKSDDYHCITYGVSKLLMMWANLMLLIFWKILCLMIMDLYKMHFKEIDIKNRVYKYCFDYLIRAKTSETKNIFIDEKNYKDIVICFTRYNRGKSMRMLSLHCHESVGKIEGKI